jgi:hypothetical protein
VNETENTKYVGFKSLLFEIDGDSTTASTKGDS